MDCLSNTVRDLSNQFHEFALYVQDELVTMDRVVEEFIEQNLPERAQHVALEIFRALPETLVCLSVLTNVAVPLATLFWATRVVWIFSPVLTTMLSEECTKEKLADSCASCLDNLFASYKKFQPGILVAATCGGVAFAALGWITANYTMMIQSTIYLVAAGMAANSVAQSDERIRV